MQTRTATITVGDWSDDGHGKVETFTVEITGTLGGGTTPRHSEAGWGCSKSPDLWHYYSLGLKATGVPDVTKYCADYEDNEVEAEVFDQWKAVLGVDLDDRKPTNGLYYFCTDDYATVWVALVNKGIEAALEEGFVKILPTAQTLNYNIGGYGLFS